MHDPYAAKWKKLEESVLESPARLAPALRRSAATTGDGLPQKVRQAAYEVTDSDIQQALTEHSQDELFELVISAALGAARVRLTKGLEALCD